MNKITTISAVNFQSLKNIRVPVGQFTTIVGPSNLGKSALLRAIRALAKNASAPGLIRQGEKEFRVGVVFEDGTIETLDKGSKTSAFTIHHPDGKADLFAKAGATSVPDEVSQLWNLSDLSFTTQHDKPFLLAEPPSEVARVLGELTNASLLMEAVRESNRLRTEALAEAKARTKETEECKQQLLTFVGIKGRVKSLELARTLFEDAKAIITRQDALASLIKINDEITAALEHLNPQAMPTINFSEIDELEDKANRLNKLLSYYELVNHNLKEELQELTKTEQQLKSFENEIHELIQDSGQCPLCGQEVK